MQPAHQSFRFVLRQEERVISGLAYKATARAFSAACSVEPRGLEDILRIAGNICQKRDESSNREEESVPWVADLRHDPRRRVHFIAKIVDVQAQNDYLVQQGLISIDYDGNTAGFSTEALPQGEYGTLDIDVQRKLIRHEANGCNKHHLVGVITTKRGYPIRWLCYELEETWKLYDTRQSPKDHQERMRRIQLRDDAKDHAASRDRFTKWADAASIDFERTAMLATARLYDHLLRRVRYKMQH